MTPEEARELVLAVDNSDPSILSELMDWKEVLEALETIAGLHYEYAVQVPVDGATEPLWKYVVRVDTHGVILTQYGHMARWEDTLQEAAQYALNHNLAGHRIVRRLAGDPEVVE